LIGKGAQALNKTIVMHSYAVSGGHEETVKAAVEILKSGGNAVDAAIAAYWMMFVAEPCMASIGAGGFAMVHFGDQTSSLDFFCQTPRAKRPSSELEFYPITVDFGNTTEDFYVGKGAAATPGAVAGIFALHKRYGSLPMEVLTEQAIQAAKNGVAIDHFQAYDLELLQTILGIAPEGREVFFTDGQLKKEGDPIRMPGFADLLFNIAKEGEDLVYKGEIARQIVQDYKEQGDLGIQDFTSYTAIWREALQFPFHQYQVFTTPSPSMGGIIIANLIKRMESETLEMMSEGHFGQWSEAVRKVFDKSKDMPSLVQDLEENYNIKAGPYIAGDQKLNGTSHFNVLDKDQNAVSLTTSLGEGNGYFIPNTQMQMNNMLGESALLPNGFHTWQPNQRLNSMMTPCIVMEATKQLKMVTGSGGAGRIPYALAETMLYYLQYKLSLADSIKAPRVYYDGKGFQVEHGFDISSRREAIKEWKNASLYFGGTHSIGVDQGEYYAVADGRRFGAADQG
jgi:gamma-glutamyltranspeptidase/glutathione hydrolase